MNFLLIGTTPYADNRGVSAIASSTVKSLRSQFKDARITLWHTYPETYLRDAPTSSYEHDTHLIMDKNSHEYLLKLPLRIMKYSFFKLFKKIGIKIDFLINDETLQAYECSDVIISCNFGDAFNDLYGKVLFSSIVGQHILGFLSGSPIVLFPQSIGTFNSKLTKFVARLILNRAKIIMVREKNTESHLIEIGVDKNLIYNVPDMAFLLEAADKKKVNDILENEGIKKDILSTKKIIGLSVRTDMAMLSNLSGQEDSYIDIMVKMINHMTKKMDSIVLIIPNASLTEGYDNKSLGNTIKEKTGNKNVFSIKGEYTAEELKGIIGICDIFIGAMMHTIIAAISMNIPSLSLSYSHKSQGVMENVGLGKYNLDYKKLKYEDLINQIEYIEQHKTQIKEEIAPKIVQQKKLIKSSILLIKELL